MRTAIPALVLLLLLFRAGTVHVDDSRLTAPVVAARETPPPSIEPEHDEVAEDSSAGPTPAAMEEPATEEPEEGRDARCPSLFAEVVSAETGERLAVAKMAVQEHLAVRTPVHPMVPVDGGWFFEGFPVPSWGFQTIRFLIEPPDGYVMESPGSFQLDLDATRFTKEVRARIIAWPEADLLVTVRKSGGAPAPFARVEMVLVGVGARQVHAEWTDERGETRVHGLPSIPGESIEVVVRRGRRVGISEAVLLGRSTDPVRAEVFLPPRRGWPSIFKPFGWCGGSCRDPYFDPAEGSAGLRVEVRRVDGSAGEGAWVVVGSPAGACPRWRKYGRADRFGNIRFDGLPAGPAEAQVREPGYVMSRGAPATLMAGRTVDLVVEEDRGVPLTLEITDPGGRGLAGVMLEIEPENGVDYAWVEGDRERIGFFTNADGRFTFPRLPEGDVRVTAKLGTRTRTFDVEAGGTRRLVFGDE